MKLYMVTHSAIAPTYFRRVGDARLFALQTVNEDDIDVATISRVELQVNTDTIIELLNGRGVLDSEDVIETISARPLTSTTPG